ncbi:hypothetical protein KUTeg_007853 [Tegillarca granosa]|uniref:KASH5-like coiled-coil domain-containing protein n=1 Tax=Tegillarca granosa TaxID=220873 RepID=A0ABQ9FJ04_TEGGR|nr:hypothetical protein KUTeg_007853 [Tegillarca granosa]
MDDIVVVNKTDDTVFEGHSSSHETLGQDSVETDGHTTMLKTFNGSSKMYEQDSVELQNKLADLQYQNRKLLEDNGKLQQQLDHQEEVINITSTEVMSLQRKIKSLQEMVDLKEEIQRENEDLKSAVSKLQDKRKDLENKLNHIERENNQYQSRNTDLEKKVQTLSSQLETASCKVLELRNNLAETKHRLSQIQDIKSIQEEQLSERFTEIGDLKEKTQSLSHIVEELRQEKNSLQLQLSQVQMESASLHSKVDNTSIHYNSDRIDTEDEQELGSSPNRKVSAFLACSTPIKQGNISICAELKQMIESEKYMPFPLSTKEFHDELSFDITPLCDDDDDDSSDQQDGDQNSSVSVKDELTLEISKFTEKYRQKQAEIMDEVDKFLKVPGTQLAKDVSNQLQVSLKVKMEEMSQRVTTLATAKDMADKKLDLLSRKKQRLKEENQRLKKITEESKIILADSDREMENAVDKRLLILKDRLDQKRSHRQKLQREIKDSYDMIRHMDKTSHLLNEIQMLKRSNAELAEKCHKSELKSEELEEEAMKNQDRLKEKEVKCLEMEELLAEVKLDRQLELKELWRLVHADIEQEFLDEQKENILSDSSCQLKEKISNEILSLKTQLQKRETELDALNKKTTLQKLPLNEDCKCDCYFQDQGSNSSSPLVEALTIDFFNGNQPVCKSKKISCVTDSEGNFVAQNCIHRCSCHGCRNWATSSNPVLNNNYKNSHFLVDSVQEGINKSTSSSTSGVLDLDLSSCSLRSSDLKIDLKDLSIGDRTGQEGDIADTGGTDIDSLHCSHLGGGDVLDNLESCISDNYLRRWSFRAAIANQNGVTGNYALFPRCRSLSFLTAIESGQKTPSDNTSLKVVESMSTDDTSPDSPSDNPSAEIDMTENKVNSDRLPDRCSSANVPLAQKGHFLDSSDIKVKTGQDPSINEMDYQCHVNSSEDASACHSHSNDKGYCWNDNLCYYDNDGVESMYSSYSFSHLTYPSNTVHQHHHHQYHHQDKMESNQRFERKLPILKEEDNREEENLTYLSKIDNNTATDSWIDTDRDSTDNEFEQSCITSHSLYNRGQKRIRECNDNETELDNLQNFDDVTDSVGNVTNRTNRVLPFENIELNTETDIKKNNCDNKSLDKSHNVSATSVTSELAHQLEKLTLDDKSIDVESSDDMTETTMKKTFLSLSQMNKIRQDHLVKRREQMKHIRMPDLSETQEQDNNGTGTDQLMENNNTEDQSVKESTPVEKSEVQNGDSSSNHENVVFPSIPAVFLEKMGLSPTSSTNNDSETSCADLSEEEVENKFTNLALAFKTDKITLEKRIEIQERSRDIAEQNVDKEIKCLKELVDTLNHMFSDIQVRDILQKIKHHVDILEQSSARVSSRSEVYGAVQQEKRISKAIEIMVTHVENLRRVHEREHAELEDARRLIQDNKPFGGSAFDLGDIGGISMSRRSASVCQGMSSARGARRRVSEVALPKALGGGGTTAPLSHTLSLDPRTKFQVAVASAAMKNSVANTLRRASLEKNNANSTTGSSTANNTNLSLSRESSKDRFEQGYKAQIGRELATLREQQNSINKNLEEVMDKHDEEIQDEIKTLKDTVIEKFWEVVPEWETASKKLRMTMAGFVFFMALCSIVLSFFPVGQAAVQVFPQYRYFGQPPT